MKTKLALITQRAAVDHYGQRTDVLEAAYTQYFSRRGLRLLPVSNYLDDPAELSDALRQADLLILTGGGDVSKEFGGFKEASDAGVSLERDRTCSALISSAVAARKPVFAICYGMQLLNCHFGGSLMATPYPSQSPPRVPGQPHAVDVSLPPALRLANELTGTLGGVHTVNHYHHTAITADGLAPGLLSVAHDPDYDSIEAFMHVELPVFAMIWHPERPAPEPRFNDLLVETILKGLLTDE